MQSRVKWFMTALVVLVGASLLTAKPAAPTGTLEGQNGWTATEVFRSTDLSNALSDWSGLSDLALLNRVTPGRQGIAENSSGVLYVIPSGRLSNPDRFYSGVVAYDGSSFTGLMKVEGRTVTDPGTNTTAGEGGMIFAIIVVPGTAGGLTTDDLLLLRRIGDEKTWNGSEWVGDNHIEIVRVPADAGSSGGVDVSSQEVLYTYDTEFTPSSTIAVDGSGNLYLSGRGLSKSGANLSGTIRKLTYSASSGTYVDSELFSDADLGNAVGFLSGLVYGVAADEILEIAPSTGGSTVYSGFDSDAFLDGMTFDGSGDLWLSLDIPGSSGYIAEAPEAGVAGYSARIANTPRPSGGPSITARAAGGLYVTQEVFTVTGKRNSYTYTETHEAVFSLTPPTGGGGGGGGNGKGKNK